MANLTLYNSGVVGRAWSNVTIETNDKEGILELWVVSGSSGSNTVELNKVQVMALRDNLTRWLGAVPSTSDLPMVKGSLV